MAISVSFAKKGSLVSLFDFRTLHEVLDVPFNLFPPPSPPPVLSYVCVTLKCIMSSLSMQVTALRLSMQLIRNIA